MSSLALLCALDFVISPGRESLFEIFSNLTLCQELLPNAYISDITMLFFWVVALVYTLGGNRRRGLVNLIAKVLGGICFEIYLCHMVIYRVLERLYLVHLFGNGLLAYIFTAVAVICVSVVFSVCAK